MTNNDLQNIHITQLKTGGKLRCFGRVGSSCSTSATRRDNVVSNPGADPGFQVRGGVLRKIAPSGGRPENFWGISCEKSRVYAKKSYFFQF